jgi:hypothetical protein
MSSSRKILPMPYGPSGKERKTDATFSRALMMVSLPEILEVSQAFFPLALAPRS